MAKDKEKQDTSAQAAEQKSADASAAAVLNLDGAEAAAAPVKKVRVKHGRVVPTGRVHIDASFNNTRVTITDPNGNVLSWCSGGRAGFKGARKSTAYAATMITQEAARAAQQFGLQEVDVEVRGPGSGRESAIRALQTCGLNVSGIRDITPIPHNGCRARKKRRV